MKTEIIYLVLFSIALIFITISLIRGISCIINKIILYFEESTIKTNNEKEIHDINLKRIKNYSIEDKCDLFADLLNIAENNYTRNFTKIKNEDLVFLIKEYYEFYDSFLSGSNRIDSHRLDAAKTYANSRICYVIFSID